MSFARDTWISFQRAMVLTIQNPVWMLISILQPILYLALFGPLLERIVNVPGFPPGDAWQIFVPGLLVQLGIFGTAFVGFGIIAEWRSGVIDRMLVTPANRTAIITGKVLRDVLTLLVQALILTGAAFLFGLRVPPGAIAGALVVVALLGATFSFLSYAAGLALKSEDALAPMINTFALPILLLSGILLPMSLAPGWLQTIANINPIKHVVEAVRALFRADPGAPEVLIGGGAAIVMVLIGAWVGTSVFRNQTK